MKRERLIQEKIIDELAYHEEVIEKIEESISKIGKGESRFNGICTGTKGFKKS
ncbi:MAG: hypothetical protein GXZ08_01265 [Tissierellia bacterium]|nr:hypothetical protein [Tissierellia bacterium]